MWCCKSLGLIIRVNIIFTASRWQDYVDSLSENQIWITVVLTQITRKRLYIHDKLFGHCLQHSWACIQGVSRVVMATACSWHGWVTLVISQYFPDFELQDVKTTRYEHSHLALNGQTSKPSRSEAMTIYYMVSWPGVHSLVGDTIKTVSETSQGLNSMRCHGSTI